MDKADHRHKRAMSSVRWWVLTESSPFVTYSAIMHPSKGPRLLPPSHSASLRKHGKTHTHMLREPGRGWVRAKWQYRELITLRQNSYQQVIPKWEHERATLLSEPNLVTTPPN
jgi:hypothetical protein